MIDDPLQEEKRRLRALMREQRRLMPPEKCVEAATILAMQLRNLPGILSCSHLLGTLGVGTELDPRGFCEWWIDSGRNLYLPKVQPDGLTMAVCHVASLAHCRPGYRNCPEPDLEYCRVAPLEGIDLILVPGLAFDRTGNRLGQGGGHYDRLLARRSLGACIIGVGYDFQVVDSLPTHGHDQRVHWIATPNECIQCQP